MSKKRRSSEEREQFDDWERILASEGLAPLRRSRSKTQPYLTVYEETTSIAEAALDGEDPIHQVLPGFGEHDDPQADGDLHSYIVDEDEDESDGEDQ